MDEWEPLIDNTKGILFFRNNSNGDIQFDYPKKLNIKDGTYEDIFFKDWVQQTIINKDSFSGKQYVWKNIKNGFIQRINPNSTTFILEAALNNNIAFFELFIEYGGDINYVDKVKRNCLHYVAINDNYILANLLIKLGCKINKKDIYGISPFLYCIKYYSFKTLKLLVKNKCNINISDNKGNTALHYAVMNKNTKLIVYLLKHGAKLEIKNKKGQFPIDVAMDKNYSKIAKALTKYSYLIEDEKFLQLQQMIDNGKYEELLLKQNKEYEDDEDNNDNIKNNKDISEDEKFSKRKSKSKKKNNKKKQNFKKEKKENKISTVSPFITTEKNGTKLKNNKKRIINLNLSPIKNDKNNKKVLFDFSKEKNKNKNNSEQTDKIDKKKNKIYFKYDDKKVNNIKENDNDNDNEISSSDNDKNEEEEKEDEEDEEEKEENEDDDEENNDEADGEEEEEYKEDEDNDEDGDGNKDNQEYKEENHKNKKMKKNDIKLKKKNNNNNQKLAVVNNNDNIYYTSFNFIKYYVSYLYMFFLNSLYPYLKDGSIKIYNYSRKKAKKMYKKFNIYMQNTYLYYNNTPDIENQIEYLNYSGLSSSIDDISVHTLNQNNKVFLSLNDIHNIESELTERKNKFKKNTNNKNWMKIRKIYKNKYVYKIPYRYLYNLNEDYKKINEQKIIQIINRYYYDHLFINP